MVTPFAGNVFIVFVKIHVGIDLSVHNNVADVALCHMEARFRAEPGDIVLGVSGLPSKCRPQVRNPRLSQNWPPEYWDSLQTIAPRRAVCWGMLVEKKPTVWQYHADLCEGCRPTAI